MDWTRRHCRNVDFYLVHSKWSAATVVTVCLSFMAWQKCLWSWYPSFCHFMVLILRIFLSKMWNSNNSGPCFNFMQKLGSFVNSLNKTYWNPFDFPPEINCLLSRPSVFSELNPAMGVLVLACTELIAKANYSIFKNLASPLMSIDKLAMVGLLTWGKLANITNGSFWFFFQTPSYQHITEPSMGWWTWDLLTYLLGRENSQCLLMVQNRSCLYSWVQI